MGDCRNLSEPTPFVQPEMDIGCIIMFALPAAQIPAGWQVADGTNGTLDLTDSFVFGADVDGDIGDTGGSSTHDHTVTGGSHTHSVSSGPGSTLSASPIERRINNATINATANTKNHLPPFNRAYYIQKVA